jgi:hypothetical protein
MKTPQLTQEEGDTTCGRGQGRDLQILQRTCHGNHDDKGASRRIKKLVLHRGCNVGCDGGNISYYSMRCASTGHACGLPRLGPALRIIGARTFATMA